MELRHDTVLLNEAVKGLNLTESDVVVDATLGAAGHFGLLYGALGPSGVLVGIDADHASIARATDAVEKRMDGPKVHIVNDNFRNIPSVLDHLQISCIDKVLFDLGWNGFQLAAGKGFSFRTDEPLLMTYGEPEEGKSAADLVNSLPEQELSDLIYAYGEERFSRGIAKSICERRKKQRILTTFGLVEAIEAGTPSWYHTRKLHPATKTFQALRIATNDELGALRAGIAGALSRLTLGGRIAIITFHSIEDRIVKSELRDAAYAGHGTVITRKPIVPSDEELRANPRARSAKLRIFERCNGEGVCLVNEEPLEVYA